MFVNKFIRYENFIFNLLIIFIICTMVIIFNEFIPFNETRLVNLILL